MNEAEWLVCTTPGEIIKYLGPRPAERQWRLFGRYCCYGIQSLLSDGRSLRAVEVAERYAEGMADDDELEVSRRESVTAMRYMAGLSYPSSYERRVAKCAAEAAAGTVAKRVSKVAARISLAALEASSEASGLEGARRGAYAEFRHARLQADRVSHSISLRCIFGNPFRPAVFDPSWRTESVTALAQGIYADRAFDRLPILVDALQEAGCDNDDVLSHCRGNGPHARGCWVVDQLLGKA